jgi:two-component system, OmpR family, osmolarity sensor histidine kinase EnvZ
MLSRLLKSFLPRSLMGRATLILVVPVTGLLLLVSIAVIQRHYDRVTRQMTVEFARVADHMRAAAAVPDGAEARIAELAKAFGLEARLDVPPPPEPAVRLPPWELSARLVRAEVSAAFPDRLALSVVPGRVELALPVQDGQRALLLGFPLSRLTATNPHQLLVLTLVAAALMTLIAFVFLRNQLRPIRRLAAAAEAFGRGETVPLRITGATEVRAAAQAFLDMRARIEAQIEQRTLMLSGVSHDLRTPLTRARLALSLMEGEPEAEALLADLAQMEGLIDRYLDFVRDGAAEPEVEVDLPALVAQRVDAARGPVRMRQPERRRAGPSNEQAANMSGDACPRLRLRPFLFARALDNLIANALRYGTRAEVWIEADPACVAVCIEDDGPGIPEARRAEALRPFVRLDAARAADGGVGLGLAIAADAMRSHGGRLDLAQGDRPGLGGLQARLVVPTG